MAWTEAATPCTGVTVPDCSVLAAAGVAANAAGVSRAMGVSAGVCAMEKTKSRGECERLARKR